MLEQEKLDSLCKDLDKFIDEKYIIPPADFDFIYDEEQKLEDLDSYINTNKKPVLPFKDILKDMMETLCLEESELLTPALINRDYYNEITKYDDGINKKGHKPEKYRLISICFALIDWNNRKENKLIKLVDKETQDEYKKTIDELLEKKKPKHTHEEYNECYNRLEEIQKKIHGKLFEILFNANDIKWEIDWGNLYDVALMFCFSKGIYEIIDIDRILFKSNKGLEDFSKKLLKNKDERYKPEKMLRALLSEYYERHKNELTEKYKDDYWKERKAYYKENYNVTYEGGET